MPEVEKTLILFLVQPFRGSERCPPRRRHLVPRRGSGPALSGPLNGSGPSSHAGEHATALHSAYVALLILTDPVRTLPLITTFLIAPSSADSALPRPSPFLPFFSDVTLPRHDRRLPIQVSVPASLFPAGQRISNAA